MLGAALILWRSRAAARPPSARYWVVLALTATLGVFTYHAHPASVGYWDIYHHYLGAKYAPELGYDKLYGATIAADDSGARMFAGIERVREVHTQRYVSARELLAHRDEFTSGFTPARWDAFRRDLAWFQARIPRATWAAVLADRGYHPTPAWDRIAGFIAAHVPLESGWAVPALVAPDQILMLIACVALARAYGLVTLGLFLIAWGATPLHLTPLKGAFLRLDWLAALLVSFAAYRRRRYALSGACLAWATLTRVFPVVFAGGVLARAAWTLIEDRRMDRRDARFLAAFAAVAAALFALGCPVSRWHDFAATISVHAGVVSQQRSGLEYLVGLGRPALYWPCAIVLAGCVALAARRMSRPRLLPAGLVLMFAFISAASYYHVVASAFVLCFHRRGSAADTRGAAALMGAYAIGAAVAFALGGALRAEISALWSILLLGLSIIVVTPAPRSKADGN